MKTTKEQRKFALYDRINSLGFYSNEFPRLISIERTLSRWAVEMCNGTIERDEKTGKPFRRYGNYVQANDPRSIHFIPDREAGALRRLKAIVDARNGRTVMHDTFKNGMPIPNPEQPNFMLSYHQTDPRGCALYLVTRAQLGNCSIESAYNRGTAICY